jgi:maleate isomerase
MHAENDPTLQPIVEDLLRAVDASRVTIRLDTPGQTFPIRAEALAPGVDTLRNATEIDLRASATFIYLDTEQRNLIQSDCSAGDYPAPPALMAIYGVKAQMLAPLVRDGKMIGILSVHYASAQREWSESDVAALDAAADVITQTLAAR